MALDVNLAERIKGNCERMLRRAEPDIPALKSKENWKALSGVAKGACQDALQLAMLELRCNDDVVSAKSYFMRARTAGLALTTIPEGAVVASSFDIPIYCCLLAHDISGATNLAGVALLEKVTPGSHFDAHAKILSAFVLDDIELFEENMQVFHDLEKLYWWEKQRVYFDLYRAVLQRDGALYNQLLKNAVAEFKLRATDKDFGEQLGEYGGLEYNQFAIDFMALGIAILAQSKGLACAEPSIEHFPTELI
jgi:hypothetical protein